MPPKILPAPLLCFPGLLGIQVFAPKGNLSPPAVTERLGLENRGSPGRVDAVHYNTLEEIARLGEYPPI